jgi:type II secretory pathway pseudopilin PulG
MKRAGIVSLVLGILLALVGPLLRDYASRQRVDEAEAFREFAELRQMAVRDLTALPRGVVGVLRRMS